MSSQEINQLNESLRQLNAPMDIYEAHGCLCGMISVVHDIDVAEWLAQVTDGLDTNNLTVRDVHSGLVNLFEQTRTILEDNMMGFQLLLPDDEEPLQDRTDALADWCQGFLFGMGVAGFGETGGLSEEVHEILRDISEIGKLAHGDEDDDENENSYMELVEYIRVGVLLVHGELNAPDDSDGPVLH